MGRFKRGGQEDEKPDGKEAGKNEPQQRADPFPFNTSRIPKSVGPVVEELPSAPLTAGQMSPQERAYQMPSVPTRQLTKRDLGALTKREQNGDGLYPCGGLGHTCTRS